MNKTPNVWKCVIKHLIQNHTGVFNTIRCEYYVLSAKSSSEQSNSISHNTFLGIHDTEIVAPFHTHVIHDALNASFSYNFCRSWCNRTVVLWYLKFTKVNSISYL